MATVTNKLNSTGENDKLFSSATYRINCEYRAGNSQCGQMDQSSFIIWRPWRHKKTHIFNDQNRLKAAEVNVGRSLYCGDAVGDVVLADDAQKLIFWQLESTVRTRSRFFFQLGRLWMSADETGEIQVSTSHFNTITTRLLILATHRTRASNFLLYFRSTLFL